MKTTFVEYNGDQLYMVEALFAQEFPDAKFPPEIQSVTICEIKEIDEVNKENITYGGARFFGFSYCAGDDVYSELEGRQRSLERAVASMMRLSVAIPEHVLEQLEGYTDGIAQIKSDVTAATALSTAKSRKAKVNLAVATLEQLGTRIPSALAAEYEDA